MTGGWRVATWPTGRWLRWVLVLFWLVVTVAVTPLAARLGDAQSNDAAAFLPAGAESTRVLDAQRQLPGGDSIPAVVVFARGNGLGVRDQAAIITARTRLAPFATTAIEPAIQAPDGGAALLTVPMAQSTNAEEFSAQIAQMRAVVRGIAPPGLDTAVSGPAGLVVDTYTLFSDIEGALLFVTGGVVAAILLLVYRSPLLWVVPLVAVAVADQTATGLIYLLAEYGGLTVNGQSAGILRVLVFGAGTDYALLMIARYREELTRHASAADAMRVAIRRAGPAILASAGTVIIGLLSLLLCELNSDRGLGPVGAVGIAAALVTMMTLLPAAMVVCGRRLFWPFIPRLGEAPREVSGAWARVGLTIARRPRLVWMLSAAVLAVLAFASLGLGPGLRQDQGFRRSTDSIAGARMAAAHYPPGVIAPTYVIAGDRTTARIGPVIAGTPGVAASFEDRHGAGRVQYVVVLADPPDSAASFATIERLRGRVRAVPGADALVGGNTAVNLDVRDASVRDRELIIPIVLGVVLLILGLLLRAVVAPVLLIGTVVLSFLAALGVSALTFRHVFGFPGVDPSLPLFGFIFLVALGVDYNIFLMTRVREETERIGTRPGVLRGLAVTGGVITSAGVVLAATFSVLFIFPLVQLAEIGFLVAFGVLLDTLVVRSVLVPALALDVGPALWWPGRLRRATPRGPAVPDARTPLERQDVQPRDVQPVPAAQAAARAASGDAPDAAARPGPDSAIPVARVAVTDEESDSAGV